MIKKDCNEVTANKVSSLSGLKGECLLITGGTGFVGTWLTELVTFLNDNYDSNTKLFLLSKRAHNFNIKAPHLAMREDVELIERNIIDVMELPDEVTMIIHAAANPDSRAHASDPVGVMRVIANGTDSILTAASQLPNLKRFLYISSGLIYGPQPLDVDALSEDFVGGPECNSISSVYSEAKRFAETLCSAFRSLYKMPIVIVRPFAFIGPYQLLDKPWAINNFIRDSLMGGPIRILGNSETARSYMYPSDMAFWLLRMLIDGISGLAYNLGSPKGVTLRLLAEKIANNFSKKPEVLCTLSETDLYLSKFVPNVTLAQKTLGLEQKVDLDEAIRRTLLWFREGGIKSI
jgi:dTDP-glucose 4,6-dehydratase